jgi:tetratricopeptide (TPR) repeat protein
MATMKVASVAAGIIIFAGTALAQAGSKELNDAFNAGMVALGAKQFDRAVESFKKALSLADTRPSQKGVLANLADAYCGLARTKGGPERDAALSLAFQTYQKLIALEPTDWPAHNNYALALALAHKYREAQSELKKAAELDPSHAGRYYYNLGAVLVNAAREAFKKAGDLTMDVRLALLRAHLCQEVQDEKAAELKRAAELNTPQTGSDYYNLGAALMNASCEAFKNAIEVAPDYAEAHWQRAICLGGYSVCLSSGMPITADGDLQILPGTKVPPGMKEELQKYLQLAPQGPYAIAAKEILNFFGQ